jgi:hypothetical protein
MGSNPDFLRVKGSGIVNMDCMMQSFALQNCVRREGLTQLIKARLSNG